MISNKGSVMLGFVLLIMIFISGIFFFSQNILGGTSLVKYQRDDIELELLMHSAEQRAMWLIDNDKIKSYSVIIDPGFSRTDLINSLMQQNVYLENVDHNMIVVGFDLDQRKFYVLVNEGLSKRGYSKLRLSRYRFSEKPLKVIMESMY